MTPLEKVSALTVAHNKSSFEAVKVIISDTLDAGGDALDVLVVLESVVAGVVIGVTSVGGDEAVMEQLFARVRKRVVELRQKHRARML